MYMIMFVLDDPEELPKILNSWTRIGVSGATIIESTGSYSFQKHIPMRYAFGEESLNERGNTTILAVVNDESVVEMCLKEVELIVGDLDDPDTGVFAAWPLTFSKGVKTS